MATRGLESFSYSLRPRVTLYFKGALFSIQSVKLMYWSFL